MSGARAPAERPVSTRSSRPDSPLDHVTPYDRFAWNDTEVEHLLATGEHQRELIAYFGAQEYESWRGWRARRLSTVMRRCAQVFVVPGIMGSQLGMRRPAPLPNDVLWLDPIDIELGRLSSLRLPGTAPIVSLGRVLYSYLRSNCICAPPGSPRSSTTTTGGSASMSWARARRARAGRGSEPVMIVAHSMGGLVVAPRWL